jgi:hypothetical protein
VRPHVHVSVARGTDLCTERGHAILREARSPPRADGTVRICWPDAGLSFEAPGSASATATETLLAVVRTRLAGRFVVLSLHFSKKQNAELCFFFFFFVAIEFFVLFFSFFGGAAYPIRSRFVSSHTNGRMPFTRRLYTDFPSFACLATPSVMPVPAQWQQSSVLRHGSRCWT